jgi:hypothetical protein
MKDLKPFLYSLMFIAGLGLVCPCAGNARAFGAPGWSELCVRSPHLISGGRIEAWVRSGGDVDEPALRVVSPFSLGQWESGLIRVPLRLSAPGLAPPVEVEFDRILLDSPMGIDTVHFGGPPSLFEGVGDYGAGPIVESCADGLIEPLWRPGDGDVLIVSSDGLSGSLDPLLDDLAGRGFRCARTRLSLILRDFGDEDRAGAIRDAVAAACSGFATRPLALILVGTASEDVPQNDLLPTFHAVYDHEYMGFYDATFAEDAAFGDLIVGRIPVRTGGELAGYVAKLAGYRSQAALSRVQFAVGDAAVNRNNSDRQRAAQELIGVLQDEGLLQGMARYASSYMPLSHLENRQRALADLQGDLAQGVGLLCVFGNNIAPTNIVHAWEAPPGPQQPWLLASEMPTAGRLPIALFGTCLNGAFDEDGHFPGYDSPAESWIREPNRGAVAVVAPSHLTTFFDDWEITGQFLRRLVRGDGAFLGAVLSGARESLLREWTRGERSLASIRMENLLGDPLIAPNLGVDPVRLAGSFELSGSWPTQNTVELDRGWTTGDRIAGTTAARIVGGTDGVAPIEGKRMMRVATRFREGSSRRAAAWKLFDCDVHVRPGTVLRAWLRQEEGEGRLGLDAVTESGLVMSDCLLDARGIQVDPEHYRFVRGRWSPTTIRLDRWAGERIRKVCVRYERRAGGSLEDTEPGGARLMRGDPLPPESFVGFIDGVSIDPGRSDPFLDGGFEEDADADGAPDGWTAPWPASMRGERAGAVRVLDDGSPSIVLSPAIGSTPGLSQRIVVGPGQSRLQIGWDTRSTDGGSMRVGLADPLTGELLDAAWIGPIGDAWSGASADLALPAGRPVLLELRPTAGTVHLRALRVEEERPALPPSDASTPPFFVSIDPNPTSGPVRIRWEARGPDVQRIQMFDISGRRIAAWRPERPSGDPILTRTDLFEEDGRPLPAGIYFVRVETSRGAVTRRLHLVR